VQLAVCSGRSMVLETCVHVRRCVPGRLGWLQTRSANPHFLPEVQAHCVVVNFGVTRHGLEQQLLTCVVGMEVPSLETDLATTRVRVRWR
jgi:hypothetical protein